MTEHEQKMFNDHASHANALERELALISKMRTALTGMDFSKRLLVLREMDAILERARK